MSGHGGGGGGKKKRRGGHGGGGGHGDARFLVTYADLLTVLMALFLVLWVLATIDLNKFKKFTQGLGDFGNPAAEVVQDLSEASPGQTMPPETIAEPTRGEITDTTIPEGGLGEGLGGELTTEQLEEVAETLRENLDAAQVPATSASIRVEARGLIVTIETDGVLFESGASALTGPGRDILAALAPGFRAFDNKVIIEGHTDHRPVARKGYDNWSLSADRAISVLRVMANDFGVPAERLAATGYGEFQPIDPGDSPEALARNRRVEIVVVARPQPGTTPEAGAATTAPAATDEAHADEAHADETHEPAAAEPPPAGGVTTTQTTAADH